MEYEVYLRTEVFEFLRHRRIDERNRLLGLLHELGGDRIGAEILPSVT